jgi:hypothetical protein
MVDVVLGKGSGYVPTTAVPVCRCDLLPSVVHSRSKVPPQEPVVRLDAMMFKEQDPQCAPGFADLARAAITLHEG